MKLYGIGNCSTVRKAIAWLDQHGEHYQFHDFKKQGVSSELAQRWLKQAGWESLVNRKGMTWRGLPASRQQAVCDDASALALMLEKPSVIRRPLLDKGGKLVHIGFDSVNYENIFKP
jgi:arsenate reductase